MAASGTMKRLSVTVLGSLVVLTLAACPSYVTMQSPRPTPPGKVEFVGGLAWNQPLAHLASSASSFSPLSIGSPYLDFAVRYGVFEHLGIGARFNTLDWSIGPEMNLRLLDLEQVDLSIAPSFTFSLMTLLAQGLVNSVQQEANVQAFSWALHLPVLIGYALPAEEGRSVMLIAGPRVSFSNWGLSASTSAGGAGLGAELIQPGLVVGAEIPADDAMRVLIELDVMADIDSGALSAVLGASAHLAL